MLIHKRKASVLILSLWCLAFLTIFAVNIALLIRQRINLLSRIEKRSQLRYIAQSGIKKAVSSIILDMEKSNGRYTTEGKIYKHNNPDKFFKISLGNGEYSVRYPQQQQNSYEVFKPGFVDEERKLNINFAEYAEIDRLIQKVFDFPKDKTQYLTQSIIDWRSSSNTMMEGFYSDAYYQNLEYPYQSKKYPFEIIDELLLVQGFDIEIYERLIPYLTIYGDGKININTASDAVLYALGLEEGVIDKILFARRGKDGQDDTNDDFIFNNTYDISSELKNFVELEENEAKQIDLLNIKEKIKTNSSNYLITSISKINNSNLSYEVKCVFSGQENKIIYWREK